MGNDFDDSVMEQFLRKALQIQLEDAEKDLSPEQLKALALRAGLSDEDWERLSEQLEAHLARGRNFLEFGNGRDAVKELDQAAILAPYRADVLADCARAHQLNWTKMKRRESRDRSRELYEKALQIDPGNLKAAEGLSELKSGSRQSPMRKAAKRKKVLLPAAIAACLFVGAGVFAWKGFSPERGDTPPPITEVISSDLAVPETESEFAQWLKTKKFTFSGIRYVELKFESDHVFWEVAGTTRRHDYTIDESGALTIHGGEEFKLTVSEDFENGTLISSKGEYYVTILPLE